MNPTIPYLFSHLRSAWSTRRGAVQKVVRADMEAASAGQPGTGRAALLDMAAGPSGNMPYYLTPTSVAAALALGFSVAACTVALQGSAAAWMQPAAWGLTALAALSGYQAVARRFGPALIDERRYAQARTTLQASGDDSARPMPVLLTAAMGAMFLVDGSFSGYALTQAAFASWFTPRIAMLAGCAWSAAMAWLLFHLSCNAAREAVINARRSLIRKLLAAPDEADRQRGQAMAEQVRVALGGEYCSSRRIGARVLLALVVTALAAATMVVRVTSEQLDTDSWPPAETQPEADFGG